MSVRKSLFPGESGRKIQESNNKLKLGVAKWQRNLVQVCQRYVAGTILRRRKIRVKQKGNAKKKP